MSRLISNAKVKYAAFAAMSLSALQFSTTSGSAADAVIVDTVEPEIAIANFVLYGQLNYGLMHADDGFRDEVHFADNDNSSSRWGIKGGVPLTSWLKAGGQVEVEIEANSSARLTLHGPNQKGVINLRILDAWTEAKVASNVNVRLTYGQGKTASDGTTEQDLSGTKVIGYSNASPIGSSIRFANATTGAITGFRVGQVFNNMDGFGRAERVRVDVKTGPVTLASSFINNSDRWDVAAFFNRNFGDVVKVAASVSYANNDLPTVTGFDQTSGSLSLLHMPTGISLTGAAGVRNSDIAGRNDRHFYYGKIAINRSVFSNLGKTAIGIDYFETEDALVNGDDGSSYGIFAVQRIDQYNTELYALFRDYDYNRIGTPTHNVQVFMTGARVKFKT